MRRVNRRELYAIAGLAGGCALCGCTAKPEKKAKLDLGVKPIASPYAQSASYRDTIGSITYFQGLGPMRVRGHGLVVGLGKNGSVDCPRPIRDLLIQNLYKHHRFSSELVGSRGVTPEQMLEDPDTAVVLVQGEIEPGAAKGSRFDVGVMALPGTQTKSLRGGRLYTTDLEMYRTVSPGTSLSGRLLAKAHGPVFMNPFADDESATKSNPLEGTVIGGGMVTESRRLRLVLLEPSHHWARQIQDRINSFVPGSKPVADAVSPSFVQLEIPEEYADDTSHFLSLIRSLYISRDPRFNAARARELADELVNPTAPHGQIALCFEGLGRSALPVLNDLYTHPKEHVSFHAAVAGLRLGDHLAGDAMVVHAQKPDGEFRLKAIRALSEATGMAPAGMCLRRLLEDEDPRIRVTAYEGLIRRRDPYIESKVVGSDNFLLDRVPTRRAGLIYVKRSGTRRIALFGGGLRCTPPILYRAPDGSVTISAKGNDEELTILRVVVSSGSSSPPIPGPFELPELIALLGGDPDIDPTGQIIGVGLDYASIVRVLYFLTEAKAINAAFVLEEPNMADLFGPPRLEGRPESEL